MKHLIKLKKKTETFLYDHMLLRDGLLNFRLLIIAALCAAIYAFGFDCFITPNLAATDPSKIMTIVTGGVGGISQNIILICEMCGAKIDVYNLQSILYFALNIPILIFSFFFVGKKFTIFTAINVGLSSLFVSLFKPLATAIVSNPFLDGTTGVLARAVFAAIVISFSSAIAFKNEISCGGVDVLSYYFSLRKSTSVGKFNTGINFVIVGLFSLLTCINLKSNWSTGLLGFFFSIVYLFVTMLIIDFINVRNKKIQIQIITEKDNLNNVLLANFPHGTTLLPGKGGYSGKEKYIINIIVSSFEVSKVVKVVRKGDPHAFISVTSLSQVYGNFFIKPVE